MKGVRNMCLQVLDTGDSSESFPGNRLDLVLTEVPGERERVRDRGGERERQRTLVVVFQALKDIWSQMINKTTMRSV